MGAYDIINLLPTTFSFPISYNVFSRLSGNDCQMFAVLIHFLFNSKNELLDVLSNLVLFYFFCPWFSFFEKSLPSSCLVFLCELPGVNACICFLSPLPKSQCFMDRLRLRTKLNFISLGSACLVCVISAFESQCDLFISDPRQPQLLDMSCRCPHRMHSCLQRTNENHIIFLTI